ncbi:hypothetical protein M569_16320 [Genlisea aurea]|uniref:separase n=1 Tax=Genlisea aurea TaxID=192259 RepID=S8D756_9LAMI|nr:hypothetical protein M569_16320 [Genlisea aurea]
MLPWESLPILRGQEVYRMPSVGSIFAILSRFQNPPSFPIIDPQDSYYLLNPGGDLVRTQNEFQDWFRDQEMMEGKTGSAPTVEELSSALGSHDLFIYFGHGSGMQYIPPHEIQKLDGCAATLLLGCSSGCLHLRGSYVPRGAPISYLLAGAPAIVANLWEVTDRDIDRFGKAVLNAWMRERRRAAGAGECCCCCGGGGRREWCEHRARIGSFMEEGREACALRFLIGAAPVCYGVPTGIVKRGGGRRRKDP